MGCEGRGVCGGGGGGEGGGERGKGNLVSVLVLAKLQALVYDILPSTTAVFSYAIGPENCQLTSSFFFVGAQTVVSLLQTTHKKQGVHQHK